MGGYISITNCIAMNEIDIEEINKYWNQKSKLELEKFLLSRISEEIKYSKNGEIRIEKKSKIFRSQLVIKTFGRNV